mmetsp:Transcript_48617/g.141666  ORF Transcript_48617/g.141666 Transcript_48617/m.141666 type:complete len:370 (+) Transcript_48617:130-1239(+)
MAPSKAQYPGYHMSFDCEAGYDVPLEAFEKHHHRVRHRPGTKPAYHGAERVARQHLRPKILARCHSWPRAEEEEESTASGEEDRHTCMPPTPLSEVFRAVAGPSHARPEGGGPQVRLPPSGRPRSPFCDWAAFASRLVEQAVAPEAPAAVQAWPRAAASRSTTESVQGSLEDSGIAEASKGPLAAKARPRGGPLAGSGDDEVLLDAGVARLAVRLLPTLLLEEGPGLSNGLVSVGRLKALLETAVELTLQREKSKRRVSACAFLPPGLKGSDFVGNDDDADDDMCVVFRGRDMRAKGWQKGHKACHGTKASQQAAYSATRRLEQRRQASGVVSADEHQLGRSWALFNKARSKQHGGNQRLKRAASDHFE